MANGPRESRWDKQCHENVPSGASGYCECSGGEKKMEKGCDDVAQYQNCNEACNGKKYSRISNLIFFYKVYIPSNEILGINKN